MHKVQVIIIVVVQVGAVKIYVAAAAVEALRKKGKTGSKLDEETQFGTKSGAFLSSSPPPP
jgi:hypothetical protein